MAAASGVQRMAKKAEKADVPKEPGRVTIIGLKGTPAFAAWVDRLHQHLRLPLPTLFEHALIELAKSRGFEEEPPQR